MSGFQDTREAHIRLWTGGTCGVCGAPSCIPTVQLSTLGPWPEPNETRRYIYICENCAREIAVMFARHQADRHAARLEDTKK